MDIEKAVLVLREGGVIAHPTDTCYGYACDYFNEKARARLCEIKKMSPDKPVSMMLASVDDISLYVAISPKAREVIEKYLPGRYTIVLPAKSGDGTIGVRVPDHDVCLELCRLFGGPLATTSANISGRPPAYSADGIVADYVLDGGNLPFNKPSTVLKVDDGLVVTIRP